MRQLDFYSTRCIARPAILDEAMLSLKQNRCNADLLGLHKDGSVIACESFGTLRAGDTMPAYDSDANVIFIINRVKVKGAVKYTMFDGDVEVGSVWRPKYRMFCAPQPWSIELASGKCIASYDDDVSKCSSLAGRCIIRPGSLGAICQLTYSSQKTKHISWYDHFVKFVGLHYSSCVIRSMV